MLDLSCIQSSRKYAAAFVILFCIILTLPGCNRYHIKPPVNALSDKDFSVDLSQFVVVYEEDTLFAIDKFNSVIDSDSLSVSIKEAKSTAGNYSNSNNEGGLLGVIIGTQLTRELSSQSFVKPLSQSGLQGLQKDLDSESIEALLGNAFALDKSSIFSDSSGVLSEINQANKNYYVMLKPGFHFSSSYNSLSIKLVVEVFDSNNDILFRNLYIFGGEPVACDESRCPEYWINNELGQFKRLATQSISELMLLVRNDLASGNSSIIPDEHISVRYQDAIGDHYIRGKVLDKKSNRMVIRTLRGYLKSVYVSKYL